LIVELEVAIASGAKSIAIEISGHALINNFLMKY
jgi:hypothetical protein